MEMENRIAQMEATITELTRQLKQQEDQPGRDGGKKREPMTMRRAFSVLRRFSGRIEDYDDWIFRMRRFLEEEEGFAEFLKWVESQGPSIPDAELTDYDLNVGSHLPVEWFNHQLYQVLAMNVDGNGLAMVKNLAENEKTRGVNAWLRITREYSGISGQRMGGLVSRIFNPKKMVRYQETTAAVESWELLVREFEKGAKTTLIDFLKIFGLKQVVPKELEGDMNRLSSTLTSYEEFKRYAMEQIGLRRDPHFASHTPAQTNAPSSTPTPMDIGAVAQGGDGAAPGYEGEQCGVCGQEGGSAEGQSEGNLMAMTGKGGGGGAGSFNGECRYCGKWGHRLNQCTVKDADMAQSRAAKGKGKGKGEFQKGQWSKGGYGGGWSKGGYGGGYSEKGKGKGGQGKGWGGKGQLYWFDEAPPAPAQGSWTPGYGEGAWNTGWFSVLRKPAPQKQLQPQRATKTHNMFSAVAEEEDDVEKCGEESEIPIDPPPGIQGKMLGVLTKVDMPAVGPVKDMPLCTLSNYRSEKNGWIKIRAIPDSGAIESVAPNDMAPAYTVMPSPGSLSGQKYLVANGEEVTNEGEQVLPAVAENGKVTKHKWQMAAVSRPLKSVGEVCDEGKRVIFGRSGGIVYDIYSGEVTSEFTREHGTYLMDLWIPPASEAAKLGPGFLRPGAT